MSAIVIPFPLGTRLTQVAASTSPAEREQCIGIRDTLRWCIQACADAAQGDEVDLEAIADLDRAVRDPRWYDIDARVVARQVDVALGWLTDAHREALVAATADGDDSTCWAAERAFDLGGALSRLQSAADWLGRRPRRRPPRPGLLNLEWPED